MTKEDLNKEFGKTKINRQIFEDMPCPICTENITDEQMSELAYYVESEVRNQYPDVADRMFDIFVKNPISDDESNFLHYECAKATELYWNLLEVYAISVLGAKYYEDLTHLNSLIDSKRNYSKKYSELLTAKNALITEQENTLTAIVKEAQQSEEGIDIKSLGIKVEFDGNEPLLVEAIRVAGQTDYVELKVNTLDSYDFDDEWVSIYDFYSDTAERILFGIMEGM